MTVRELRLAVILSLVSWHVFNFWVVSRFSSLIRRSRFNSTTRLSTRSIGTWADSPTRATGTGSLSLSVLSDCNSSPRRFKFKLSLPVCHWQCQWHHWQSRSLQVLVRRLPVPPAFGLLYEPERWPAIRFYLNHHRRDWDASSSVCVCSSNGNIKSEYVQVYCCHSSGFVMDQSRTGNRCHTTTCTHLVAEALFT